MSKEYKLSCQHVVFYDIPPRPRDHLFCYRCQEWKPLAIDAGRPLGYSSAYPGSPRYDVRCLDCTYYLDTVHSTRAGTSATLHSRARDHLVRYHPIEYPDQPSKVRWIFCGLRLTPAELRVVLQTRKGRDQDDEPRDQSRVDQEA